MTLKFTAFHTLLEIPLCLQLSFITNELRTIYAKAENMNMTGSIKDRMAIHIIKKAYSRGKI